MYQPIIINRRQRSMKCVSMITITIVLLFCQIISICASQQNSEELIVQQWIHAASSLDKFIFPQSDSIVSLIERVRRLETDSKILNPDELPSVQTISPNCSIGLETFATGIQRRQLWAYRFLKASAGYQMRFLEGYTTDLGSVDNCLSIGTQDSLKRSPLKGKYCLLKVNFPLPSSKDFYQLDFAGNLEHIPMDSPSLNLSHTVLKDTFYEVYANNLNILLHGGFEFGICVPDQCQVEDIQKIVDLAFNGTYMQPVMYQFCETSDSRFEAFKSYPFSQKIIIMFMITMASLIIFATILNELLADTYNIPILKQMSLVENSKRVFTVSNSSNDLAFINGVRLFLNITGVTSHMYIVVAFIPQFYALFNDSMDEMSNKNVYFKYIKNLSVGIECYFVLSGFLSYYGWSKFMKQQNGKISFVQYAVKRWLRSTPTLAGVIMLHFLWPFFGSGPLYKKLGVHLMEKCQKYWWANIFYLSNWLSPFNACIFQSWSLSSEFQIYIFSFFLIVNLYHNPRRGIWYSLAVVAASIVVTVVVAWYSDLPPVVDLFVKDRNQFKLIPPHHLHTYLHVPGYVAGLLAGYAAVNNLTFSNKKYWNIASTLSTIFVNFPFVYPALWAFRKPSRAEELVYIALFRVSFSASMALLYYGCAMNYFPSIRRCFSHRFFVPFSRLSFSLYLSQFLFIFYDIFAAADHFPVRPYNELVRIVFTLIMTILLAFLVYLFIEAPTTNLIQMLMEGPKKEKPDASSTDDNADNNKKKDL